MRVALFHDDDRRVPRLRADLAARDHEVFAVGPGASQAWLRRLFDERRPDVLHSLGRGPTATLLAAWWRVRLGPRGTRRAVDVAPGPAARALDRIAARLPRFDALVDGVIDGSQPGAALEAAYLRLLGLGGP